MEKSIHIEDMKKSVLQFNNTKFKEIKYLETYLSKHLNGLHTVFQLLLYDVDILYRNFDFMTVS